MPTKDETAALKAKGMEHYWMRVIPFRAKAKGVPHNVTLEYLKELPKPEKDPLGIQLDYYTQGRVKFNTATIDRIDNTKGYIKGNIRVVSHKLNSWKGSSTPLERLRMFLADIDAHKLLERFLSINTSQD